MKIHVFTPTRNFAAGTQPVANSLTLCAAQLQKSASSLFSFFLSVMGNIFNGIFAFPGGFQFKEAVIEMQGHQIVSSKSQINLFKKEF